MLQHFFNSFQKSSDELRTTSHGERVTAAGFREGHGVDQVLTDCTDAVQKLVESVSVGRLAVGGASCRGGTERWGIGVERSPRVTVLFKTSQFICDGNLWTAPIEDRELSRVQTSRRRDSEAAARQTGSEAGRT